jgi:hypothetical protein
MFYLSLDKIRKYAMCPQGPKIIKWFEDRFPEDMDLPLITVFEQFGDVHTVFCLRAVDGGPEFALDYARDCVKRIQHKFEDEFPDNPLFRECIAVVNLILMHSTDTLLSSAREAGHNMEVFCNSHHTNTSRKREHAIKAGLSASRLAYAAYTLKQPHSSVDYSLGAVEEAMDAADNDKLEDMWQKSHLESLLMAHKDDEHRSIGSENKN